MTHPKDPRTQAETRNIHTAATVVDFFFSRKYLLFKAFHLQQHLMLCIWSPFFPTHCPLPPRVPLALRCLIHWSRPAHNLKLQEILQQPSLTLRALSCFKFCHVKSHPEKIRQTRKTVNQQYIICMCICTYIICKYTLRSLTKAPQLTSRSWTVQGTFPLSSAAVADPTACCGGGEGCLKSATHHAWDSDLESNQSLIYCDWLVFSRWCWNA